MKLIVILIIVLALIALAQIMRVYQLSSKLRNKDEAEVTEDETKFNAFMLVAFMVIFLISSAYLIYTYGGRPGLGESASEHGKEVDWLYDLNWVILLIVFFITQPLLFIFSAKYKYNKNRKATFFAHSNKLELIWTILPSIVLAVIIISGLSIWGKITSRDKDEKYETIELYAKQFDWTARYTGADGKLGKADFKLLGGTNALGVLTTQIIENRKKEWNKEIEDLKQKLDTEGDFIPDNEYSEIEAKIARLSRQTKRLDPLLKAQTPEEDKAALDDVIVKELVLVKGKNYEFKFRSQDVIHSAYFPHFRSQMNCVPGMVTKFYFTPSKTTEEMRKDPEIMKTIEYSNELRKTKGEDPVEFDFILLCNKICGASHFNMQMKITVVETEEEYYKWFNEQKVKNSFGVISGLVEAKEENKVEEVNIVSSDSLNLQMVDTNQMAIK